MSVVRSVALFSLLALACASARVASPDARYEWSAGPLRLVLERTVGTVRSGSTILGWFGGGSATVFQRPYGVAWDGDDLLVVDPDADHLFRIDPRGNVRRSMPLDGPTGVAVCGAGIVVTEPRSGRVVLLDRELRVVRTLAEGLTRPTGTACYGEFIVVVETGMHRLVKISASGTRETLGRRGGGDGEFNFPVAVAVAGDTAFIGDALNFRVQRLDLRTGHVGGAFGTLGDGEGDMPRLKGIAVEGERVWVSDEHLDHLALFDRQGRLLAAIGQHGAGPGEFSFPCGVAVSGNGRIAVADSLNARVQIFRIVEAVK